MGWPSWQFQKCLIVHYISYCCTWKEWLKRSIRCCFANSLHIYCNMIKLRRHKWLITSFSMVLCYGFSKHLWIIFLFLCRYGDTQGFPFVSQFHAHQSVSCYRASELRQGKNTLTHKHTQKLCRTSLLISVSFCSTLKLHKSSFSGGAAPLEVKWCCCLDVSKIPEWFTSDVRCQWAVQSSVVWDSFLLLSSRVFTCIYPVY